MERRRNHDSFGSSQGGPRGENIELMGILKSMMENQQKQTKILHQGLLMAHHEQRPGNVSEFRKLQPAVFSGTEKSLDAEQWLQQIL